MGWLSNLINRAKKKTEETVNGVQNAAQQSVQTVQNVAPVAQNVASSYGEWLTNPQGQMQGVAQQAAPQVIDYAKSTIDQAAAQAQGEFETIVAEGNAYNQSLIDGAQQKTQEMVAQGQQIAQNVAQQAIPAAQNAVAQGQQMAQNAAQQAIPVAQNAVQQGQQIAQNVAQQAIPAAQNAVAQGQQMTQNAVQQGQAYVKDAAGNFIQQATPIVHNAVQQGQQMAQNAVAQGQQMAQNVAQGVKNTVQNASQAITDKVVSANNQIQGNTPSVAPAATPAQPQVQTTTPATTPTDTQSQVPTSTPVTTPTQTTPTVQQQTPTNTPTQENGTFAVEEPILSYEDYLKKESEGLGYIKDKVTQQTDQQSADTLKHIDEALASGNKHAEDVRNTTNAALEAQKQADTAYAESQRDLMINTSQAERDEVYKYAEETLAGALGYNNEAYGKLVEAITGQMEAGKLAASEAKNLLMIMAEEVKNTTYGAAERQREEAERQADINRQRAIADANSAYEQNKASYGAKAEALGDMGLTAGGYGDWLNASAYAQQRGEVQGARARSDAAKREAKYTEDMTKLQADQDYSNKKYQAESDYQNKLYDIDTSYRANLSEAEQSKLAADKAAQDAERETKQSADSKHRENVYNAESTYGEWLNRAETAEREGKLQNDITYKEMLYGNEQSAKDQKLEASQKAENAKLNAEISYVEGILGNSKELAQYKESLNAGTKEAEEKKAALYAQMLSGASSGEYGPDEIASLADAFGFSQEWKNQLISSANNYAGKVEDAENKAESEIARDTYTKLLNSANAGAYNEAQIGRLADEYGLSAEQKQSLIDAAKGYADKVSKAEGNAEGEQKTSIYTGMLDSVNSGAYTAEQISYLADRYGLSAEDKQSLIDAANKYASDNAAQSDEAKATQATKSFVGLLESANAGQLTAEELQQIATEFGLSDAQKDLLTKAAERYAGNVSDSEAQANTEYKRGVYTELLDIANNGGYNVDQIGSLADEYGLSDSQKNSLIQAAQGYADKVGEAEQEYADAEAKNTELQQKKNYVELLNGVYSGIYDSDIVSDLADEFGLTESQKQSLLNAAGKYANEVASGKSEADADYKNGVYTELLNAANAGGYTAEQVKDLAKRFGLGEAEQNQLANAAQGYADKVSKAEGEAAEEKAKYESEVIRDNYTKLLNSANAGAYNEAQIGRLADEYGLSAEQKQSLIDAAKGYAEKVSKAEGEAADAEAENKAMQQKKTYVDLLNGIYGGAYDKDLVSDLADEFGLTETQKKSLIAAADRYASEVAAGRGESDAQYKRGVYTELLDIANRGGYNEAQIKSLASEYGLTTEQTKTLVDAAKGYADKVSTEEQKYADAEAENKAVQQKKTYVDLLSGVYSGAYDKELVEDLADEFGLSDSQKQSLIAAAGRYADDVAAGKSEADSEYKRGVYTELLDIANRGGYNEAQIKSLASEYGLTTEQTNSLIGAAKGYADKVSAEEQKYADAEAKNEEVQQRKTYVDLLSGVYSGAYDKDLVSDLADEFGLTDSQKQSLINAADRYASDMAEGNAKAEGEYKRGVYTELLDIANRGGYNADQIGLLADEYGLSESQKQSLISAADGYSTRVNDEKAQIEAETKLNVYTNLLDAANMGGYTEEQIANLATRYGLDEAQTAELRAAAKEYSDKYSDAVAKDEAAQKNMNFINLLGSANLGELTKDELANVATALGLDDGQKELLAKAAERYTDASDEAKAAQKSMNFVSLLDGANTGAYNAEQIEAIAKEFGFDATKDKALLDMLKTAANDFAKGEAGKTAKEDMQYQNGIYAELLAAANNGDYNEAQIKDLAKRFGLDSKAQNLIGESARLAAQKAEKETAENSALNILDLKDRGYISAETTDDEIEDYIDSGLIDDGDREKVKEERTKMATSEVEDLIKNGNYNGAVAKAEELREMGYIDNDTYQNAYFEAKKNSAATEVKTANDIADYTADLKNMLNSGKISQSDYNSLLSYMYQSATQVLNKNSYRITTTTKNVLGIEHTEYTVSIDGTTVTFDGFTNTMSPAGAEIGKILSMASNGSELVMFDGDLYLKKSNSWWKANDSKGSSSLKDKYSTLVGRQPKTSEPKHKADPESTGAVSTGIAGSKPGKETTATTLR